METSEVSSVPVSNSKGLIWTGRVISAIPTLFMMSGIVMLIHPSPMMQEQMKTLGYADHHAKPIVFLEIGCALIYAIPQTAVLGAILMTGYLGGAVASHFRIDDPGWFVPVIFGVLVWLGLVLRDARLRAILPFRSIK